MGRERDSVMSQARATVGRRRSRTIGGGSRVAAAARRDWPAGRLRWFRGGGSQARKPARRPGRQNGATASASPGEAARPGGTAREDVHTGAEFVADHRAFDPGHGRPPSRRPAEAAASRTPRWNSSSVTRPRKRPRSSHRREEARPASREGRRRGGRNQQRRQRAGWWPGDGSRQGVPDVRTIDGITSGVGCCLSSTRARQAPAAAEGDHATRAQLKSTDRPSRASCPGTRTPEG